MLHYPGIFSVVCWLMPHSCAAWNTFFLEHWSFSSRIAITSALLLVGLVGVAVCEHVNFVFALFAVTAIGTASALGESVVLGYLKVWTTFEGAWGSFCVVLRPAWLCPIVFVVGCARVCVCACVRARLHWRMCV